MIQDLADKVWSNPRFQKSAKAIERAWLLSELRLKNAVGVSEGSAARAISAAAILACSSELEHRIAAFRLATYIFELFEQSKLPFDSALRVVLSRLGNFPSISTRSSVDAALPTLPWALALEELSASERHSVHIGNQSAVLTDFQYSLWQDLNSHKSVAFSAPTSGGKSFVLELYLAALFASRKGSVIYLVPTRALITQVSAELSSLFRNHRRLPPEIITVPIRQGWDIPDYAIYVMTQERMHLSLLAQPNFKAKVVIVDEAHSISEGARGILLQTVIEELLVRNPQAQLLFASPTTRNLDAFGRVFQIPNLAKRFSREPTVAQNFLMVSSNAPERGQLTITAVRENGRVNRVGQAASRLRMQTRVDQLAHIPIVLCRGQPNLIYANGADEAEDVALRLYRHLKGFKPTPPLQALSKLAKETVHPKYVLADCVLRGVGFHYANIPAQLRQEIERAFASGDLKYLVCTSTLLQGVNLPARNIFMLKPTRGQGKPLESPDFWNLAGRAGRLRREFQGNIFLINYSAWPRKSLQEPKDSIIAPAIESSIKIDSGLLLNTIRARRTGASKSKRIELESAFVRLFADFRDKRLDQTFARLQLNDDEKFLVRQALTEADIEITLPSNVLRQTHNISPHKQQRLYQHLRDKISLGDEETSNLIPLHPADPQAFISYSAILELCHRVILDLDTSKRLHRFHALLAKRWMLGWSIPRIITESIKRNKEDDPRTIIRNILEAIENAIRFQTIRLFGCYKVILEHALSEIGKGDQIEHIPDVELFLEIGASNRTTISLISLGLSRALSIRLTGIRSDLDPELNVEEAFRWLRDNSLDLERSGLSPLQAHELKEFLDKTDGASEG